MRQIALSGAHVGDWFERRPQVGAISLVIVDKQEQKLINPLRTVCTAAIITLERPIAKDLTLP
jgi:hypothetical protein